ncbi:MAG: thioredoxin-like domain-containing protein [Lentimicrobium sp.]|jgi:thiol-disulfide isomerase/thioredoxin|nr:thioredoxin-like domain-containing protein [Lentimicrobium sp.]
MKKRCLRRILLIALSINAIYFTCPAQSSYHITFDIEGLSDSLLLLAHYAGDKQFVVDTAYPDNRKQYTFTGKQELLSGMYFIAGQNKSRFFDFLVSDSRNFTISGIKDQYPQSLKVKDSKENKLFFDYMMYLNNKQSERNRLYELYKRVESGSDSARMIENQIELLNDEVQRYIKGTINSNTGTFMATFLNAMQEPEIPEIPNLENGRPDSTFAFRYFKAHFWDNIDLADGRIIRTPFLHGKVEQYLTKLTLPLPDSLIISIDHLMPLAGDNFETFKYLMWYLTIKYESSEIMGYDAVFVHLVDTYYDDPRMSWMNKTVKENLTKKANSLRNILIGKVAPEMILFDTLQRPVSLHKIDSDYTLIYFWDPDCSHCKKETPLLHEFYKNNKDIFNLEVYAVCMDTSWKDMKNYIIKNGTTWINVNGFYSMTPDFRQLYDVHSSPVMFLLDRKKNIIAKRLLSDQMEAFIRQREKSSSPKSTD